MLGFFALRQTVHKRSTFFALPHAETLGSFSFLVSSDPEAVSSLGLSSKISFFGLLPELCLQYSFGFAPHFGQNLCCGLRFIISFKFHFLMCAPQAFYWPQIYLFHSETLAVSQIIF